MLNKNIKQILRIDIERGAPTTAPAPADSLQLHVSFIVIRIFYSSSMSIYKIYPSVSLNVPYFIILTSIHIPLR